MLKLHSATVIFSDLIFSSLVPVDSLFKTREFSAKKWYKMKTTVSHLKEKSL